MNRSPISPLFPDEQQKIMGKLYLLMGEQVRSYHRQRHMGNNSSVPVELAQDLMASVQYTVRQAGGIQGHDVEAAFRRGQQILEEKLQNAKRMLELVTAWAPVWQTHCRWEALHCLRHYLDRYDHLHLAHLGPDVLFYPTPLLPPEGIEGIDIGLFYLNILWIEDQIMAAFPGHVLEDFWDCLPAESLDQCTPLIMNCIGKVLLGARFEPLSFTPEEHHAISRLLRKVSKEDILRAAEALMHRLGLNGQDAFNYLTASASTLIHWTGDKAPADTAHLFL